MESSGIVEQYNNDNRRRDLDRDTIPEIPPNVDPTRPPQRNDDNCPCQCGRACLCTDSANSTQGQASYMLHASLGSNGDEDEALNVTIYNGESRFVIADEQSNDEHLLVDIEHHGLISLAAIIRALAKLGRHSLPTSRFDGYHTPLLSPSASGVWSSGSMLVEHDSAEHSMVSSQALSMRAASPTLFTCMGGAFEYEQDGVNFWQNLDGDEVLLDGL